MMKRPKKALLAAFMLAWIAGILSPMYAVTRRGGWAKEIFDWVFYTETAHVVMHMFLYVVLTFFLAAFFVRPGHARGWLYFSVLLAVTVVGVSQEAIQLIFRGGHWDFDDAFDICVDLAGGALGTTIFLRVSEHWRKPSGAEPQNPPAT